MNETKNRLTKDSDKFKRFKEALERLDLPKLRTITVWTSDLKDFPGLNLRVSYLVAKEHVKVVQFAETFIVVEGDERLIDLIYGAF